MSTEQKGQTWVDKANGLVIAGAIALLLAFVPVLGGGEVRPLFLLVGVLLVIGGAIVNAIRARPRP